MKVVVTKPPFSLLTCREAGARYEINLGASGLLDLDQLADRPVLVCEGDWVLPATLRLDWAEGWGDAAWRARLGIVLPEGALAETERIAGLLVLGDLQIDGALINADLNDAPFLAVRGHLMARALVNGGAAIIVEGCAHIAECVIGRDNHGGLDVAQRLRTTVLIRDGHMLHAGEIEAMATYEPRRDGGEMDLLGSVEAWLPQRLRGLLADHVLAYGDIWRLLCQDRSVVRAERVRLWPAPPRHVRPLDAQDCLERASVDEWFTLRLVPPTLRRDDALLLALTRLCPRFYRSLPRQRHLRPAYMLAHLDSGGADCLFYLEDLISEDPAAERAAVLRRAVDASFVHLGLIPGYFFDAALFEHAQRLHGGHPDWPALLERHGLDYWRHSLQGRPVHAQALHDKASVYRTADGLMMVWECFWTEDFLLRCIHDWWGNDAQWIPLSRYTPAVLAAVAAEAPERIPVALRTSH